ncbi:MAG: GNAT family protein [Pseudomonadota bacterium]
MHPPAPVTLEHPRVRLEPLEMKHLDGLKAAAADGALWQIRYTSVPEPAHTGDYIEQALAQQRQGQRLPFAVIDTASATVVGSTSFHDIVPAIDRLEIGYTWYAKRLQRTHLNTCCKWLLMQHAFDTLGAALVGWRTDILNLASQRAIERLGARKDGVLRHHAMRRDGSVRDTVMYSLSRDEWPGVDARLRQSMHDGA